MSMKALALPGIVILLAACSPSPSPTASSPSAMPPPAASATLDNDFSRNADVRKLASCAAAALINGDGDGWKAGMQKLRDMHNTILPGQADGVVQSDAVKALFDAQKALKSSGMGSKENVAGYIQQNCAGVI